jgi:hypothetical protein
VSGTLRRGVDLEHLDRLAASVPDDEQLVDGTGAGLDVHSVRRELRTTLAGRSRAFGIALRVVPIGGAGRGIRGV